MGDSTPSAGARGPGRPREFDVEEALASAADVFCQRGYQGTSISDLVAGMDLTRGSFYKAFKEKRGLFLSVCDRYVADSAANLQRAMDGATSGRDRLRAVLSSYAQLAVNENGRKGCLVVATAMQLTILEPEVAERVRASFERVRKLLVKLIRQGKADGSVNEAVDERVTAELLLCLLQGMRVVGKTAPETTVVRRIVDRAMQLLA